MKNTVKIHGLFIAILLAISTIVVMPTAEASRVPEIEQFYLSKTREFLQLRFPNEPFSVSVIVDTGRAEPTRKDFNRQSNSNSVTNLPYLDIEEEELEIWDRTDIPLNNLIAQLRRVELQIQIDSSMSDEDIVALQDSLATHLKLDPGSDAVKIYKMDWTKLERYRTVGWVTGLLAFAMVLVFGVFYLLAKLSVRSLVKGLGTPIRELGQSTKKFADDALSIATEMSTPATASVQKINGASVAGNDDGDELTHGSNLLEIRESALELIDRNKEFFANPDANFMDFLNKRGQRDPETVGSILAELHKDSLKHLFENGSGDWWFVAISHPGPLSPKSISVLSEIDKMRLRMTFNESGRVAQVQQEFKEEGLIFSRIPVTNLADIFGDLSIEKALGIFEVMPRTKALAVAKEMYPGQWAAFLLDQKDNHDPIDRALLSQFMVEAQKRFPKRKDAAIQKFFEEMDLSLYLDTANTRDERDFYVALPKDSNILNTRTPFFSVFDASKGILKTLGTALSPQDWALVLTHAEHHERDKFLNAIPERLSFRIHEEGRGIKITPQDEPHIRYLKRSLVAAYIEETNKSNADVQDLINEIDATQSIANEEPAA